MITPDFWKYDKGGFKALLLSPFAWGVSFAGYVRQFMTKAWQPEISILCVGNLVVGGAGKTPVCIDLGKRFIDRKVNVNYLSRGYGGDETGPYRVDPNNDNSMRVGDESLILSKVAPTWISRNRILGAKASIARGAGLIIMDDGLQNPTIQKTFSVLVIDGDYGFGNEKVLPAGPLREPLERVLKRINIAVVIGQDKIGVRKKLLEISPELSVLSAGIVPGPEIKDFAKKPITAFAGIGYPEKFFSTLERYGCKIVKKQKYPDHHFFLPKELFELKNQAKTRESIIVTTEKDWVRLPKEQRSDINFLTISIEWADEAVLESILDKLI